MQCMFDLQSDTCIATDRGSVFRCSRRLSGTPSPDQLVWRVSSPVLRGQRRSPGVSMRSSGDEFIPDTIFRGGPHMRKASIVAGSIAAATAGSAAFGGIALASCHHHSEHHWGGHRTSHESDRGGNGTGGTATNNCLNIGVPILSGIGIAGTGAASGASCTATANGTGGNAY